jgi:hypothetical protein
MKLINYLRKYIIPDLGGDMTVENFSKNHFPSAKDIRNYDLDILETAAIRKGEAKKELLAPKLQLEMKNSKAIFWLISMLDI